MVGMVVGKDDSENGLHLYAVAPQFGEDCVGAYSGVNQDAFVYVADIGAVARTSRAEGDELEPVADRMDLKGSEVIVAEHLFGKPALAVNPLLLAGCGPLYRRVDGERPGPRNNSRGVEIVEQSGDGVVDRGVFLISGHCLVSGSLSEGLSEEQEYSRYFVEIVFFFSPAGEGKGDYPFCLSGDAGGYA